MVICLIYGVEETILQKCDFKISQTYGAREQIPHFTQEIQLAEQHLADEELDTKEPQQSQHVIGWHFVSLTLPLYKHYKKTINGV